MGRGVLTAVVLGGAMSLAGAQKDMQCPQAGRGPAVHRLEATPSTIAYGWYDAAGAPVLCIASGDTIDVDTLLTNSPAGLTRAGLPADQVQESLTRSPSRFPARSAARAGTS